MKRRRRLNDFMYEHKCPACGGTITHGNDPRDLSYLTKGIKQRIHDNHFTCYDCDKNFAQDGSNFIYVGVISSLGSIGIPVIVFTLAQKLYFKFDNLDSIPFLIKFSMGAFFFLSYYITVLFIKKYSVIKFREIN